MRRWNGPIGSRSSRLPAFTEVDMVSLPLPFGFVDAASRLFGRFAVCFAG